MELSFENQTYNGLIRNLAPKGSPLKIKILKTLIPVLICWLPLVILTLILGSFWTGNLKDSFITNFDSQIRFLVSLPILIFAEELISKRLGLILHQFKSSGFIPTSDIEKFNRILARAGYFLYSKWTLLALVLLCYIQVFGVLAFESEYTSVLTWQVTADGGEIKLNAAGWWNALISRPIMFFLFLQWLLRIVVWGWILRRISQLDLILYPIHPDLVGGLGFVGYALRFFSPIAFAISATIAGNMADFILIEGLQLKSLALPGIAYFLLITLLFTLPLFSFTDKLLEWRERSVFENYDFAHGMYRELRKKSLKGFEMVDESDLHKPDYSAVSDLNAIMENSLNMKFTPFTIKDLVPLWSMTALPFLAVILIEVPIGELFKIIISVLA
jgi:hypothetical protein